MVKAVRKFDHITGFGIQVGGKVKTWFGGFSAVFTIQ